MDRDSLERLARFFGRERLGHLYLKAWRFLVDGMAQRLRLPDYVGERILDHALAEFDSRLEEFRRAIDARPSVWIFSLGWTHAEEILKGRTGDRSKELRDADFWAGVEQQLRQSDHEAVSQGLTTALDSLTDGRHRLLLCLDAVTGGPANRQVVSESTGIGLLLVDDLRDAARAALRAAIEYRLPDVATRTAGAFAPPHALESPQDPPDPLASSLRYSLTRSGFLPPVADPEALFPWLQHNFPRSRAEIALTALWKRLPPPEKIVEEKPQAGPMVALAESLFQRIESLEKEVTRRMDSLDGRLEPGTIPSPAGPDSARPAPTGGDFPRDPGSPMHDGHAAPGPATPDSEIDRPWRDKSEPLKEPPRSSSRVATFESGTFVMSQEPSPQTGDTSSTRREAEPEQPQWIERPGDDPSSETKDLAPHEHEPTKTPRLPIVGVHAEETAPATPPEADPSVKEEQPAEQAEGSAPSVAEATEPPESADLTETETETEDQRQSRLAILFRSFLPQSGEKTHERIVKRLERYLPAGARGPVPGRASEPPPDPSTTRAADPQSRPEAGADDPGQTDTAEPGEASRPGEAPDAPQPGEAPKHGDRP